jgi:hypothetical protein
MALARLSCLSARGDENRTRMTSLEVSLQAVTDVSTRVHEESAERPLLTGGGRSLWPSEAVHSILTPTHFQFRDAAVGPVRPRTSERVAHADDRSRTVAEAGD